MRTTGGRAVKAVAAVAILGIVGCSAVLGIEPNRHVAAPADSGAPAPVDAGPDRWSCLSNPTQNINPSVVVSLQLLVMNASSPSTSAGSVDGGSDLVTVSGDYLSGVTVEACSGLDTACQDTTVQTGVTDDGGAANFLLHNDFNGFFNLERPDLVPARLYPGALVAGETPVSFPAYDISPADFTLLASTLGNVTPNLDPSVMTGHALVTVYDCQDHQAPDVSFTYSSPGNGIPFYFNDTLPNLMATHTDSYGLGGIINVPTGLMMVQAWIPGDGGAAMTQVGQVSFQIRAGAISFAWIRVRSH